MVAADGGDTLRSAAPAARVTADLLLMSAHGRMAAEERRGERMQFEERRGFLMPATPVTGDGEFAELLPRTGRDYDGDPPAAFEAEPMLPAARPSARLGNPQKAIRSE